jgi:CcmD family protein
MDCAMNIKRFAQAFSIFGTATTLTAASVFAEEASTVATSVATSLAAQETTVPGGTLLMIAYIALWLLFSGYLFLIMRRQKALSRDLESLERRIDEALGVDSPR